MHDVKEIWKRIQDSDGHFYISNLGRMKREEYDFIDKANRYQHRELKIWDTGTYNKANGYYSFRYRKNNGEHKNQYVHRLVAEYFIENFKPEVYNQVNHIDGNKSNNYAENLEWCDGKKNMQHASKHGLLNTDSIKRKIQASKNARKGAEKIKKIWCEYDLHGNLVQIHHGGYKNATLRLTYHNHTWRDGEILIQQYGTIPTHLDVQHSFHACNYRRKFFIATLPNGTIHTYTSLKDLPITRDELWYCFNHHIPDSQNRVWNIVTDTQNTIPTIRKYKTVQVYGYDDNHNLCLKFNSKKECVQFLNVKGCSGLNKAIHTHKLYHGYFWEAVQ